MFAAVVQVEGLLVEDVEAEEIILSSLGLLVFPGVHSVGTFGQSFEEVFHLSFSHFILDSGDHHGSGVLNIPQASIDWDSSELASVVLELFVG